MFLEHSLSILNQIIIFFKEKSNNYSLKMPKFLISKNRER